MPDHPHLQSDGIIPLNFENGFETLHKGRSEIQDFADTLSRAVWMPHCAPYTTSFSNRIDCVYISIEIHIHQELRQGSLVITSSASLTLNTPINEG